MITRCAEALPIVPHKSVRDSRGASEHTHAMSAPIAVVDIQVARSCIGAKSRPSGAAALQLSARGMCA